MTDFNLSERIINNRCYLYTEDVKEFIRLLKEEMRGLNEEYSDTWKKIDKLAGDKLTK